MNSFKTKLLTAVVTISAASFYFAQEVQDSTKVKATEIEGIVLTSVADIAKDRKTPVAVSTIKEGLIQEKLGNQEFPEILNNTPSVYAVKGGGGFGESKLNIRGFDQKNIAVMVNGVPVNDMENGAVYWSNWSGLSDVTSAMQVQRGLGSSKLAIASVGGTVNVLTRAADKKQGGKISLGVGNDDYLKTLFSYNTGKSEKGWSSSFLMSRTSGSTYIDGSDFEAYNYYFALGFQPNKKHDFQFTITGAPQNHNNRYSYINLQDYFTYGGSNGEPNRKYNPDWGYKTQGNGQVALANRMNYYHKPVMSFNWDWNISEKSRLNTVAYASFGRGGGVSGNAGKVNGKSITDSSFKTANGQINWDAVYAANAAQVVDATSPVGNTIAQISSVNSHNWFGAISSFNHKINDNFNFTVGVDGRYYYGYHYQVVSDLLGASGYKDAGNKNLPYNIITNTFKTTPNWNPFGGKSDNRNDMINFDNDGEVLWYGGFGQLEYSNDKLSAFVQGSLSNQGFQRIDHFIVDGVTLLNNTSTVPTATNPALNKKTGFKNILGYNVKAGVNYNIDDHHNVFGNIGYYSKQPFMNSVYPNNKNFLNPNLTNEKVFGMELGYGFRSSIFDANVNLYRTSWKDRFLRRTGINFTDSTTGTAYTNAYANIQGITEIHQGIEVDANAKVNKMISINGMISIGDWYYEGNATSNLFAETNEAINVDGAPETTLYLDKVKVGGSAQFTASLGTTIKPIDWFSFDASYRAVRNLYGNVNPINFQTEAAAEKGALKLPSFGLVDLGVTFNIKFKDSKNSINLRGNVYNLLDKVYISEANTNIHLDDSNAAAGSWNGVSMKNQVYFGFGRTWSATVSYNF